MARCNFLSMNNIPHENSRKIGLYVNTIEIENDAIAQLQEIDS